MKHKYRVEHFKLNVRQHQVHVVGRQRNLQTGVADAVGCEAVTQHLGVLRAVRQVIRVRAVQRAVEEGNDEGRLAAINLESVSNNNE